MQRIPLATRLLLLWLALTAGCAMSRPVARLDATAPARELQTSLSAFPLHGGPSTPSGSSARRVQVGTASFYGDSFDGRTTASGETFDQTDLTAAHPTLGFGTRLRVTNLENRKSVVVTVNDRGPYVRGRIIDLSRRAARVLGFVGDGTTRVRLQPL